MRKVLLGPLLGAALLPFSLGSSAVADTPMATPDGRITTDLTLPDLSPAPGPVALESTVSTDSALDPVADPSGPPGNFKHTLWGYEAAIGLAKLRTYQYTDPSANTTVTPGPSCVPTYTDGSQLTSNGRGVAFDPLDGNLWVSKLNPGFAGDGKIHKVVPPNVDTTCPEVDTLTIHSKDGKPVQDDMGALDVDPAGKHIWAAGYKPVAVAGGPARSYLYLINRNNGLIIQSCWLPFRDGGVGNGTLSTMRLPSAVDPFGGSGNYLLTDAGEPDTIPNSVAVIDQAACHNGQQATSLGELPKAHGIDGLDYEWNGSTSNDVFVGFYNDGGPVPAFGLHFVGLNAGSLIEDISMCGYQATFGGSGNDMCPYP